MELGVGVPRGLCFGLCLFAVYCSPVGDIITDHGVHYHQYADDTQLHLAMSVDNTAAGLSVLGTWTADVRRQSPVMQVPTEMPAAQPGQVRGCGCRHCESAVCRRLIHIISIRRQCGSSGS